MRKIYFKLLVGIIVILWIVYFIQTFALSLNEGFTSKINSFYRPYVRTINQNYKNFVSNYGPSIVINKLKKWNIF
jgi:hypothetical protein